MKEKELNVKLKNRHTSVFSGQGINYSGQIFSGAKLKAIFGGIDLDLSKADIENGAQIEVFALFGGIDIKLPEGAAVHVKSRSIFGGVDNKVPASNGQNEVYIQAICIFGGCDIKTQS